jgi:hypothetical protein
MMILEIMYVGQIGNYDFLYVVEMTSFTISEKNMACEKP